MSDGQNFQFAGGPDKPSIHLSWLTRCKVSFILFLPSEQVNPSGVHRYLHLLSCTSTLAYLDHFRADQRKVSARK